ncbi:hypothetical protein [Aeromicrobium sp.]|uniref:hypothetical protein n=1 Tax=Aeromicrobium sp. TaxID=1871063 RepID=UPI002FC64E54
MNLSQYVDEIRQAMLVAADSARSKSGGEETQALESTARLVLLDALSAAASEITSELAPGSVDVRLRGRDPEFVVTPAPSNASFEDALPAAPVAEASDDTSTTRTTLRLPDQLKGRVEEAANREGLSVNTWLVRAISAAIEPTKRTTTITGGNRLSGWVN